MSCPSPRADSFRVAPSTRNSELADSKVGCGNRDRYSSDRQWALRTQRKTVIQPLGSAAFPVQRLLFPRRALQRRHLQRRHLQRRQAGVHVVPFTFHPVVAEL